MALDFGPQAWTEDLDFLREELPQKHLNLFHTLSPEDFESGIEVLKLAAEGLSPHQNVVGLAALLARIGDGHSGIRLTNPALGFRRLPLRLYLYSDGLFVRQARPEQRELAGARVLAIGDRPTAEAVDAAGRLVNHENEMGITNGIPALLTTAEVLHALGLAASVDGASFDLELTDGSRRVVTLAPNPEESAGGWVDVAEANGTARALWRSRPEAAWWFEHLPADGLVYMQYNRVANEPEESFKDFCARLFGFVQAESVRRLVVDLRLNGGGNGYLNQSLIHGIIRSDLNERGRLFAVIGRTTFSAAMMCTMDLERETQAVFVGEPTSAKPNHYSESGELFLPNSGVPVGYSWLFWQLSDARDARPWVAPHLPAALSSRDDREGRDPAFEAILAALRAGETLATLPSNRIRWRESAQPYEHQYGSYGVPKSDG